MNDKHVDPDQMQHSAIYTVYSGLFVPIHRVSKETEFHHFSQERQLQCIVTSCMLSFNTDLFRKAAFSKRKVFLLPKTVVFFP